MPPQHPQATRDSGSSVPVDPQLLRDWIATCVAGLDEVRGEINDLNVFPIPDSDTGSNMLHTMTAALEALQALDDDADLLAVSRTIAEGAVGGARGNSGVILSQVMVGLADAAELGSDAQSALTFNALCVTGLRMASLGAKRAVSDPMEGTVLTVLRAGAATAAEHAADSPADLARAVADSCAEALDATTEQLDVLARSGVVDAGGRGLLVLMDSLVKVVTGVSARRRRYTGALAGGGDPIGHAIGEPCGDGGSDETGFEVMYVLDQTAAEQIAELRAALDAIGEAVVIVGDSSDAGSERFSVHVHTDAPGVAVEAGLERGRVSDVRISCFLLDAFRASGGTEGRLPTRKRAVVAVVKGDDAAELFAAEGATVVRCDGGLSADVLAAAIIELDSAHVVVMANGALPAQELLNVAASARSRHRSVVMLPTASMAQALAAMAVHDISRPADDDAYAMAEAAAAAKYGSVTVASERMLTFAGMCEPGDLLGKIGDDVLVIDPDRDGAAAALVDLLMATGGELITVLAGCDLTEEALEKLEEHVRVHHPGVELVSYRSGQPDELMQIGVE
ncbi:DAK2 domain-containing protein [Jongsikchunia kroppenstedtii]|uniref:DAK2 domain-containing protein n=1 Tax=Jongsikchunia kroppenstedtii TaxID=1121721 RepID=UPI000364C260